MKPAIEELERRDCPSTITPPAAPSYLTPAQASFWTFQSSLVAVFGQNLGLTQAQVAPNFATMQATIFPPPALVSPVSQAKELSQPAPMPTHSAPSLASLDAAGIAEVLGIGSK